MSVENKAEDSVAHTPGPWVYLPGPQIVTAHSDAMTVADIRGFGYLSCNCDDPNRVAAEMDANGHLMAAAPDLLEALIYMRRTMYSNDSEESIKADAAIAKALGKVVN